MKTLLECFSKMKDLPITNFFIVKKEEDLIKLPFPYYMKVSIAEHKLEKKGVVKIENLDDAKSNYNRLRKSFPNTPVVIQEEVNGVEMIIGLKEDKTFGKIMLVGFGGTNAEILKDVEIRVLPVDKEEIKKALSSLKLYPSLYQRKKYAIEKFVDLAYKVSKLPFSELDLNPVILTEEKAVIIDSRGEF